MIAVGAKKGSGGGARSKAPAEEQGAPPPPGWGRFRFKGNKVWARVDGSGRPVVEGGRVEVRYSVGDEKGYVVSPDRVQSLDDPVDFEEGIPEGAVVAYTDGACTGNPGPAGIGVVLRAGEHTREISEYLGLATNNIAELTAIRRALQALKPPVRRPVWVLTDSEYAIGVLAKGWKAQANQALVEEIRGLLRALPEVRFRKVPGHAGVPGNERADALARQAIAQGKKGPPIA